MLDREVGDELSVRVGRRVPRNEKRVRPVPGDQGESVGIARGRVLGMDQRHAQRRGGGPDARPLRALPVALHPEEGDAGRLGNGLLEQLQPLGLDLGTSVDGEPGDVAAGPCEARHDPGLDRIGG